MNIKKNRTKVIAWKPLSTDGCRQRHSNKKTIANCMHFSLSIKIENYINTCMWLP